MPGFPRRQFVFCATEALSGAQQGVRPLGRIEGPPTGNEDSRVHHQEEISVQKLIAQLEVEALEAAISPKAIVVRKKGHGVRVDLTLSSYIALNAEP